MIRIFLFTVGLVSTVVWANYDCVCNHAVERPVYPSPNNHDSPIGYLHEFDCKSSVSVAGGSRQYKAIAFEHKLGYVELDGNTEVQICLGDPPPSDIIISTRATKRTTHIKSTHPTTLVTYATVRAYALWPNGTYGLMKAATGCPGGRVVWQEGARKFDTEDSDAHNYFSSNVWNILSGAFDTNDITTEFCMKIQHDGDDMADEWPSGNYCILQYGFCPDGFKNGSIFWDGDDWNNHNSVSGVLPNGTYSSNTQLDFCCRSDGYPEDPIELPTAKPFVLFRYGYLCQQVTGMTLSEAFVRWDDEDTLNTDSAQGAHPYDDGGSSDHKLHFCHYSTSGHVIG